MQLPAEIRNIIYGYALTDPNGINLIATIEHRRRKTARISATLQENVSGLYYKSKDEDEITQEGRPVPLVPALLAVSKQIYQEGIDVLYSNEFIFSDSFALYSFMINMGTAGAKHMKKIKLRGWLDGRATKGYNHCCFAALIPATNLTSFHIERPSSYYSMPNRIAIQLYRDAFPWLESMGAVKGKLDAGVDVLQLGDDFFGRGWGRRASQPALSDEEKTEEFKAELSRLLGAQQNRVMGKAPVKKRKATKTADAEEA